MRIWISEGLAPPDDGWVWCKEKDNAVDLIAVHPDRLVMFDDDVLSLGVARSVYNLAYFNAIPRVNWNADDGSPAYILLKAADEMWDKQEEKLNAHRG